MKIIQFDRKRRFEREENISYENSYSNVIPINDIKRKKEDDFLNQTILECKKNIETAVNEYRNEINSALNDFVSGLVEVSR